MEWRLTSHLCWEAEEAREGPEVFQRQDHHCLAAPVHHHQQRNQLLQQEERWREIVSGCALPGQQLPGPPLEPVA